MRRGLAGLFTLLGASTCGEEAGKSLAFADHFAALAQAKCERGVRCGTFPDVSTCRANSVQQTAQVTAGIDSGKIKYDGSAAAACVDALSAPDEGGSCSLTVQLAAAVPRSCRDMFQGTVADNGACFLDEECVSRNCDTSACPLAIMCCAARCAATSSPVLLGGDCANSFSQCAEGTICKTTDTGSICTTRTAPDQPCTELTECAAGYVCNSDRTAPGTCARLPEEGQSCSATVLFACDESTTFCDPVALKCVRKVSGGGACPSGPECIAHTRCDTATRTCVPRGRVGEGCTAALDCLDGLTCAAGQCLLPTVAPACP
ncbi:MAG: hypothetical protein H7X95_07250 [Deltaproteobacteria bacterium]|nr:hypothetical protein [Deltaproteobacteria bacterium]